MHKKFRTYWSPLAKHIALVVCVTMFFTYFQRDMAFAEDKKEPFVNLTVSTNTISISMVPIENNDVDEIMKKLDLATLVEPDQEPEPEPESTKVPAETTIVKEEEPVVVVEEKLPRYQVYDEDTQTWVLMPDISWESYLRDKCVDAGIEEFMPVLMIQLWEESRFKPDAISAGGDHGLAQINQCNHVRLRKALGITDFLDPYQSIDCQIYMMAPAIKEYGIYQALSLYNTGKIIDHTPYSDNIMRQYNEDYCVLSSNY